jgi:hypothetical protein
MNDNNNTNSIGANSNRCNSNSSMVIDPTLTPATFALEKLNSINNKFLEEMERKPQRRVRLLSEGDGDYDPYHSFIVSGIETRCEEICRIFDGITSLDSSQEPYFNGDISIKEVRISPYSSSSSSFTNNNANNNLKRFLSVMDEVNKRDRDNIIVKKRRRLVRCIALESRLVCLDRPYSSA